MEIQNKELRIFPILIRISTFARSSSVSSSAFSLFLTRHDEIKRILSVQKDEFSRRKEIKNYSFAKGYKS